MATVTIYSEPLIESFGDGFDGNRPPDSCSGDALNIAGAVSRVLGRLGEYNGNKEPHTVSVLCGLGDDAHGDTIRQFMKAEAIASDQHAVKVNGRKTSGYIIHRKDGGKTRAVEYTHRGPDSAMCQLFEPGAHQPRAEQTLRHIEKHTDIFIVTGIGASRARSEQAFKRLTDMMRTIKNSGGKVIVDFNHRFNAETGDAKLWVDDHGKPLPNGKVRARMDRLFALADIAFVAHDELWPVYGGLYQPPLVKQDAADAAPIVAHLRGLPAPDGRAGPRHIMFKRGKDGGTLYFQNGNGHGDTLVHTLKNNLAPEMIVDRNGGGDNLIGGTVAGLLSGYSLDQALNIGQRMAGKVLQHPGGVIRKEFLPGDEELTSIIPQDRTGYKFAARAPGSSRLSGDDLAIGHA